MGSGKSDEIRARGYFQGEIGNSPLINKLDLTRQKDLEEAEVFYVERALRSGLSSKAKELSPDGLKQMHKELFGEVYDWAGSYRTYATGRGFPFCRPEFIDNEITKLYQKLNDKLQVGLDKKEFIKISAWFVGELNTIHPFIDGNGRTQRQVLSLIAEKSGFKIDINSLDKEQWYKSAEECHLYAKHDGFEKIISSIIEKQPTLQENLEYLSPNAIRENYPNISNKDIEKIQLQVSVVLEKYQAEEVGNIALSQIISQLPKIETGEIKLPEYENNKSIGGR